MKLWRLYRQAFGSGLDGAGGLYRPGRWHLQGHPCTYFGATAAIAVLEKLAHLNPSLLESDLMLGEFEGDLSVADAWPPDLADLATDAIGQKAEEGTEISIADMPADPTGKVIDLIEALRVRLDLSEKASLARAPTSGKDLQLPEIDESSLHASRAEIDSWVDDSLHDLDWTRGLGDQWLAGKSECLLRVPSIIVPEERNYLFNPQHPDAGKLKLVRERLFIFDGRLL